MRDHDSISTLFLVGLSSAICVESIRLGKGSPSNPGPGLFPFVCGITLGILSLISFFLSDRSLLREMRELLEAKPERKVIFTITSIFIYPFLAQVLGFRLATTLWMFFVCHLVGRIGWKTSIFISVATTFGCYYLFSVLLTIQFPRGVFGF